MAQYTFEDIEILRQKSGISYEEAVNLLEYHNGSLARSLVDLEKNGRLKEHKPVTYGKRNRKHHHNVFQYLYRLRVTATKGDVTIVNLSVLFIIFALLIASWLVIISAIVALFMGYRFAVEQDSKAFSDASLEDMVKSAGNNVKNAAFTVARNLGVKNEQQAETQPGEVPKPAATAEPEKRTETPASGTTRVNVQFSEDGEVRVSEDGDGYHEAEIQ